MSIFPEVGPFGLVGLFGYEIGFFDIMNVNEDEIDKVPHHLLLGLGDDEKDRSKHHCTICNIASHQEKLIT